MSTYAFQLVDPSALSFDRATGTFTVASTYDPATDRVRVDVTDDDVFMDGDEKNNEVGEDANQSGTVTAPDGSVVASGLIYGEELGWLEARDGTLIRVDVIEIDGVVVGYSTSRPLTPGVTYTYKKVMDIDNSLAAQGRADTRLTYKDYAAQSPPCFVTGTRLETPHGHKPVETIEIGDLVRTLDHDWQRVRWHGTRPMQSCDPMETAVEIGADALRPGCPRVPVSLSAQHRVMLCGPNYELYVGAPEVFVAARHLLGVPGVTQVAPQRGQDYHHLLFDRHEVLLGDGLGLESLFPGDRIEHIAPAPRLLTRLRAAPGHRRTARPCLNAREAAFLVSRAFGQTSPVGLAAAPAVAA